MLKTYTKILAESGWPNIFLVSPVQFEHIEGDKLKGNYGISAVTAPALVIDRGLRGKVLANTIHHELGHLLFKSKPHWWIYLYGTIMAKGGNKSDTRPYLYGHTEAELPDRKRLVHLTVLAAKRFNKRSILK
jgi:hypothetical protein